jgi:hypothetical protein
VIVSVIGHFGNSRYITLDGKKGFREIHEMARLARVVIPGMPHPITQRGNRRQTTFFCDEAWPRPETPETGPEEAFQPVVVYAIWN